MEAQDFEMPSPKRQRTESPSESRVPTSQPAPESNSAAAIVVPKQAGVTSSNEQQNEAHLDSDMLDVLMQHVESEAAAEAALVGQNGQSQHLDRAEDKPIQGGTPRRGLGVGEDSSIPNPPEPLTEQLEQPFVIASGHGEDAADDRPRGLEPTDTASMQHLQPVSAVNGLPPTSDSLVQAQVPPATMDDHVQDQQPEQREWETDSSPYDTSDSSDTSTDSSEDDSDDSEGEEYTLLDPYEQARILMAEDGGGAAGADSDDEGTSRPHRSAGGNTNQGMRTLNEQAEAILPKPDITVTESMVIEELGWVEAIVENTVLIKAKTSGEYQVLESGSVLCLADRKVIGAVSETLGRVEEPLYTVRFASSTDIDESGVSEKGTKIFYVKDHSTFVFTQPLKAVKGSDASNLHDEEVGDDEVEFSDDEAEAEHKRQIKLRKKGIDPNAIPPHSRVGRGGRGRGQGANHSARGRGNSSMYSMPGSDTYADSSMEMNYDDVEDGETDYTPLKRPEQANQISPSTHSPNLTNYQNPRGSRGRRSNRGRGRGGYQNHSTPFPASSSSMYAAQPPTFYPTPSQSQAYFNFQPPPPPQLTPSPGYAGNTMPPSPMTPLPAAGGGPGPFNFTAAASSQWAQYHQNQNAQFAAQQAGYGGAGMPNAEAIAQVQRQLEELRRQTQGGPGGSWS